MKSILTQTAALLLALNVSLFADPLDEAKVSRAVNDVEVTGAKGAARRITAREVVSAEEHLSVGPRSRAELIFPDHTLVRLGAETGLALKRGERELTLSKGTLLLEVPGYSGGARVHLGPLTATCGEATILLEHLPEQSVKVVVLAGELRISSGGFFGDSIVVPPGKMLITTPEVSTLPDPVDVDLSTLIETSGLIEGSAPLTSMPRIRREIARQTGAVEKKRLIPTNLAIVGSGTKVVIPQAPIASGR